MPLDQLLGNLIPTLFSKISQARENPSNVEELLGEQSTTNGEECMDLFFYKVSGPASVGNGLWIPMIHAHYHFAQNIH